MTMVTLNFEKDDDEDDDDDDNNDPKGQKEAKQADEDSEEEQQQQKEPEQEVRRERKQQNKGDLSRSDWSCAHQRMGKKSHAQAQKESHLCISLHLFEYLLRIRRDYEDMERRYNALRQEEFLQTEATTGHPNYYLELVDEEARELMKQWPGPL